MLIGGQRCAVLCEAVIKPGSHKAVDNYRCFDCQPGFCPMSTSMGDPLRGTGRFGGTPHRLGQTADITHLCGEETKGEAGCDALAAGEYERTVTQCPGSDRAR